MCFFNIPGITEITVTNADANTIRVTVTGEAGVPTVELFDSPEEGLIFGVASAADAKPPQQPPQTQPMPERVEPGSETQADEPALLGEEEINIVVTGEQETGYSVPDTSTATRTDTPLRDIPQSIQVVPQEVLRDQQVTRLADAIRNVSGVTVFNPPYYPSSTLTIRGFNATGSTGNYLRNGIRERTVNNSPELTGIERLEILFLRVPLQFCLVRVIQGEPLI